MKPDVGALASLEAVLLHNEEIMRLHDQKISSVRAALESSSVPAGEMSIAAYALHNLYSALENSFEQVSATFENHLTDRERWHRELLTKMSLNVRGVRPAVLSPAAAATGNELLKFRHVFRHAYETELDPQKLTSLVRRWESERDELFASLAQFRAWLAQQIESTS